MRLTKEDYILRSFSKIKHKKWELYVITRIIHLLNDPHIEFVCQQQIKKSSDGKSYLDLFFPQLKIYLEIDEAQHAKLQNKKEDENRKLEIVDATKFSEIRINVYDENTKNYKNINEINIEVDSFINFIKKRKEQFISKNAFFPWDYERKFSPEPHKKRGYLDVKDNVVFQYHKEALGCFGYKGDHYQRAAWTWKEKNKRIWFPKLYEDSDWNNSLSDDGKKITMERSDNGSLDVLWNEPKDNKWYDRVKNGQKTDNSIVFAHNKDNLGRTVYKFLGEFEVSLDETDSKKVTFIRKKTKIRL